MARASRTERTDMHQEDPGNQTRRDQRKAERKEDKKKERMLLTIDVMAPTRLSYRRADVCWQDVV